MTLGYILQFECTLSTKRAEGKYTWPSKCTVYDISVHIVIWMYSQYKNSVGKSTWRYKCTVYKLGHILEIKYILRTKRVEGKSSWPYKCTVYDNRVHTVI